jgi:hypothetical protein
MRTIEFLKTIRIQKTTIYIVALILVGLGLIVFVFLNKNQPGEEREEAIKYTRPDWASTLPQDEGEIQDIETALPYVGEYFTVYSTGESYKYRVEYAPFLTRDEAKPLIEGFLRENDIPSANIIWDDDGSFAEEEFDLEASLD